ncbi:class GN sortase [Thalassotalea aquiviva]|uniref:class GN sortase n=1 Tax=Thalassotalea aquiviva TaxID=3242415 RepID=UPI00352BA67B
MKYIPVKDLATIKLKSNKVKAKTYSKALPRWQKYGLMTLLLIALGLLFSAGAIHAKASIAQVLLARSWHHHDSGHLTKPWPWADTWAVAKIEFPSLKQEHIVLSNDSGHALAFGPGLNGLSSKVGQSGNIIIGGHRDTHFSILQYLNPQEEIILRSKNNKVIHYQVSDIKVVDTRKDTIYRNSEDKLILVTCYPFEQSSQPHLRYVVEALPVKPRRFRHFESAIDKRVKASAQHTITAPKGVDPIQQSNSGLMANGTTYRF